MTSLALAQPTLVLNKHWVAIGVRSVAQAILKVARGNAKIIDPNDFQQYTWEDWTRLRPKDDEDCVRSINRSIRIPDVIILTKYDKLHAREMVFNRRNLFLRDENVCQYCGNRCKTMDLSIDHVIPRSRGGQNTWLNCVTACLPCNVRKANRTPQEAKMTLVRTPRKPAWLPVCKPKLVKPTWEQFVSELYWNVKLEK